MSGQSDGETRKSFSKPELSECALAWMRKSRREGFEPDRETYNARLGLLVEFIDSLFEIESKEASK